MNNFECVIKKLYGCDKIYGPYLQQSGKAVGRRLCHLETNGKITTRAYAKLLLEFKLGRLLQPGEEADHIDNDPTNDHIDNIQLLTSEENRLKRQYMYVMYEEVHYGFHCAWCNTPFLLKERHVKMRLAQNVEYAFCSRSCAASFNHYKRKTDGQ